MAAALLVALAGTAWGAPELPAVEQAILLETNALRRARGLTPLKPEPRLERAAEQFARFIASRDELGHEADGRTPAQRARAAGYRDCMVAENLAHQFRTTAFASRELAERFVAGWAASPGHRANLLDAEAVEVGIAVARSEETSRFYAVQLFGRPASMRVRFEVRNESARPVRYRVGDREYALDPRATRRHEVCGLEEVAVDGAQGPVRRAPRDGDRFTATAAGLLREAR